MKRPFRFQQFVVRDQGAAMKVGTDGVLLGSWCPVRRAKRVVDIGTGSGLVALMLGQRTVAKGATIHAIDIDDDAARQAIENFVASPWADRFPAEVSQICMSLEHFAVERENESRFDLAVCNPPYFSNAYLPTDDARQVARHTDRLPRESLFRDPRTILSSTGRLCLILPYEQVGETIEVAEGFGFHLWSRVDVRPNPTAELKRVLLEFGKQAMVEVNPGEQSHTELVVESARHTFSAGYQALTQDFHLRFTKDR